MFLFISPNHPWMSLLSIAFFLLSFLGLSAPSLPPEIAQYLPSSSSRLLIDPMHALVPTMIVLLYSFYALFAAARGAVGFDAAETRPSLGPDELRKLVHRLPLERWLSLDSISRLGVRELRERLSRRRIERPNVLERCELVDALQGAPHETLCCICHDELCDGIELRVLPCCHYFHVECVDRWLLDTSRAPACPLCNTRLDTSSAASHAARPAGWGARLARLLF